MLDPERLSNSISLNIRNSQAQKMTAREAFADLQGIVGEEAGAGWHGDRRLDQTLDEEQRDPWATGRRSG